MAVKDYGFKKATEARTEYDHIPTGSFFMDILLGGGFIAGSSVEIYGQTQTGKTFLAQHTAAQVQKGLILPNTNIEVPSNVAWVDMENQFDRVWAEKCGVNLETLYTMEDFTFMEDALGAMITALEQRFAGLYVYDSVGASLPKGQLDKKIEDALVTSTFSRAKVMKVAMDSICHALRVKNEFGQINPSVVIFLNHAQPDIANGGFGYTSGGGDALKLLASTRLYFWNSNAKDNRIQVGNKGNELSVGQRCFFDVKKHRGTAAKESRGWFDMYRMDCTREDIEHKSGEIDRVQEVVDIINGGAKIELGEACEVDGEALKDGHYYNLPELGKVHGSKQLYQSLYEHPEVREEVEKLLVDVAKQVF